MDGFIPYIFSIFSNPPEGTADHLPYLDQEKDALQELVRKTKTRPNVHVDYHQVEDKAAEHFDAQAIADYLYEFRKKLTIVHYSGHASETLLSLRAGNLRAENFIKQIGSCENIRIVVLNGCSTRGFVKQLLETTPVKAVIATDNPVKDKSAKEFSIQFYKRLLNGEPVAGAFTGALSVVLANYKTDSYLYKVNLENGKVASVDLLEDAAKNNGTRNIKKGGQKILDNDDKPATWGIYTRAGDLLNWNLYESATDSEKQILEIDNRMAAIRLKLFPLQDDIEELKADIKDIEDKPARSSDDNARCDKKKTKLEKLEQEFEQWQVAIKQLEQERLQYAEDKNIDELIRAFSESVINLNYEDQSDYIAELQENDLLPQYACFVLNGTDRSCLHLLSRRLRIWLGFEGEKKAIFDFDSSHADDFWVTLQREMIGTVETYDRAAIVQRLITVYRDGRGKTINNFLLIFRNRNKDPQAFAVFNQSVFTFWKELVMHFKQAEKGAPYDHGIYAFIIDDTCELIEDGACYKSSKEKDYQVLYMKDEQVKSTFTHLPVVAPLKAKVVWSWQQNSPIRNEYRYKRTELESLIIETKGHFLDTVEAMGCSKVVNEVSKQKVRNHIRESIDKPL